MKIILDAMGGDHAPLEIVKGALAAAAQHNVEINLVGVGDQILAALEELGVPSLPSSISITHASEVIGMCDDPATAFREKPDSSVNVGLKILAESTENAAFLSAGNTGALLAGANFGVGRIKGIRRGALSPVIPTAKGGAVLIDCGANVTCKPEYLVQFAVMGSVYAKTVLGRQKPLVGLLNNGAEETKGPELQRETFKLLREADAAGVIHFFGNIEGRDVVFGGCDVVVADGYAGNILLKTTEGVGLFLAGEIKNMFYKNTKTKLCGLLLKKEISEFKKTMDYTEVGGSPFLGFKKPVVKAHGSSNAKAIASAVRQAKLFAEGDVAAKIAAGVAAIKD